MPRSQGGPGLTSARDVLELGLDAAVPAGHWVGALGCTTVADHIQNPVPETVVIDTTDALKTNHIPRGLAKGARTV